MSASLPRLSSIPSELLTFSTLRYANSDQSRLGTLCFSLPLRIQTPHYIAISSRGTVPHLSQDMMRDNTSIAGIYAALEDYIEKLPHTIPPVYKFPALPSESPLRKFIALQRDAVLILGPRRIPPVICPASNTYTGIKIMTAVGFGTLESEKYVEAAQTLRPDVVLGLGDVVYGTESGPKRIEKMGDRTLVWLKEMIAGLASEGEGCKGIKRPALFAPILPVDKELQSYYLDHLGDEMYKEVQGVFLYNASSVDAIPASMEKLPRLALTEPKSPHRILHEISLGFDLFTISFIDSATDAGIALDFSFPALVPTVESPRTKVRPLGLDMWSSLYATSRAPLSSDCICYTCTFHHRAYLQHLLSAKEMLGWVLLQVHNHHIIDMFFDGVRQSIKNGSFSTDRRVFERTYETELPSKTGQGPRVRGYQYKSEGPGEKKKNPSAYRTLHSANEKLAEANLPSPDVDGYEMEEDGIGELLG